MKNAVKYLTNQSVDKRCSDHFLSSTNNSFCYIVLIYSLSNKVTILPSITGVGRPTKHRKHQTCFEIRSTTRH